MKKSMAAFVLFFGGFFMATLSFGEDIRRGFSPRLELDPELPATLTSKSLIAGDFDMICELARTISRLEKKSQFRDESFQLEHRSRLLQEAAATTPEVKRILHVLPKVDPQDRYKFWVASAQHLGISVRCPSLKPLL